MNVMPLLLSLVYMHMIFTITLQEQTNQTSSEDKAMMTVRVKVEQPDIILVEDLSTHETSCIIFHVSHPHRRLNQRMVIWREGKERYCRMYILH